MVENSFVDMEIVFNGKRIVPGGTFPGPSVVRNKFRHHDMDVEEIIVGASGGNKLMAWCRGSVEKTMLPDTKGVLRPTPLVYAEYEDDVYVDDAGVEMGMEEDRARDRVRGQFDRLYGLDGLPPAGRLVVYGGVAACE